MWLLSLIDYVTGFIPRPTIIRPDEGGFRIVPIPWSKKTWITELQPNNWYWNFPWFNIIEVCSTKTQAIDIRAQSVWTKNGSNLALGVSIRYHINNPVKALLEVHNYDQSLQNIILSIVCEYVGEHTVEELRDKLKELIEKLTTATREEAKGWGIKIEKVGITDIGVTQNYRLLVSGINGINGLSGITGV